jgi:hypothetical protein
VNRKLKLASREAALQLIFVLDSVYGEKESLALWRKGHTRAENKKGATWVTPLTINALGHYAIALTREDRRDILREAVFLW